MFYKSFHKRYRNEKGLLVGQGHGLQSNPHESVLSERQRVYGRMCRATGCVAERRCYGNAVAFGASGQSPECAFLLQAFSFSHKKKMLKGGLAAAFGGSKKDYIAFFLANTIKEW